MQWSCAGVALLVLCMLVKRLGSIMVERVRTLGDRIECQRWIVRAEKRQWVRAGMYTIRG